ncbi:M23 family metallopeptidase [Nakamurella sp.]|uniref:M23 family metallopeptidase n=1 Tax=Nakamurella sp. TaxID=1869182 RepID=UPI003B3AC7C7
MRTTARPALSLLAASALLVACTSGASTTAGSTALPSALASSTPAAGGSASAPSSASSSAPPSASSSAPDGTGSGPAAEVLTPVLGAVDDSPAPVTGTDGRVYLAYELYLTNATSTPVTIDSVAVRPAGSADGAPLQEFSGSDLLARSRVIGATPSAAAPTAMTLQGGQVGVVWLDPSVATPGDVPAALDHVVAAGFAQAPNPLVPAAVTETIARTAVSRVPAAVIASPLSGDRWLNGNGCCNAVTAHRGALNPINGRYHLAERFAIDWVQLNADDQIYRGDKTDLASYAYYGAPIHAVADGEVVAVSDSLPDQPPGADPPAGSLQVDQFGGNYVVERFTQNGQDYYAFYAHLKPGSGSAAVTVGQQISAGDQVGALGNSGNSDAPHLHFHVMDGPNPLASNGLPYVFDALTMVGRAASPAAIDAAAGSGAALPLATGGPTGPRTDQMPLWMDVVDLQAAQP